MSIPVSIDPLGTLGGGILPPSFPLREHVITGRVNGKTIGLDYEGERVESYGAFLTRYPGVGLGYDFAACIMIRGVDEPDGSTLTFDARKAGEAIIQVYLTLYGLGIYAKTGKYDSDKSNLVGANMRTFKAFDESTGTFSSMQRTGEAVTVTTTRLSVPTYSHALAFDRELTEAEFAEVVAALRAITN